MASTTLTHCQENLDSSSTKVSHETDSTNDYHNFSPWPAYRPTRALSCNEERANSVSGSNHNRLKHFCSTIKRRFSISKECRTRSDEINRSFAIRMNNYKSFPSSIDESGQDFEWPDFERIYDTIPSCLANALPGLDDLSLEDDDEDNQRVIDSNDLFIDDTVEETLDQMYEFQQCKRGKHFHRNAVCQKLDKSLYNGQMDTFIQQLMVEKLIRTWT